MKILFIHNGDYAIRQRFKYVPQIFIYAKSIKYRIHNKRNVMSWLNVKRRFCNVFVTLRHGSNGFNLVRHVNVQVSGNKFAIVVTSTI